MSVLAGIAEGEPEQLRRCLRDLLALNALPAVWQQQEERQIAENTADALIGMLDLGFVCVLLRGPADPDREVLRLSHTSAVPETGDIRSSIARRLRQPFPQEPFVIPTSGGVAAIKATSVPSVCRVKIC